MGKVFRISGDAAYGRRIFPLMLALLACLVWVSAANAQEAPFDSQYSPPPTTPECEYDDSSSGGGGDSASPTPECAEAPSDTEGPLVVLPTTGGSLLTPALLGLAVVVGAGVVISRRGRSR
jgi:LPXTG-motif cell wall-anchored protein